MPYESGSFDIVSQLTVFTPILDDGMKQRAAKEMIRVLKPGGYIMWSDFFYSNPANKDVKGVGRGEIRSLFQPECKIEMLRRYTLLPPISRRLANYPVTLCSALEAVRDVQARITAL